jgi:ABC-type transport system involved in multi-copper enzyme maturation permease subunit
MTALVLSELRQRIRGKRWWILLLLWTFILGGLTWLVRNGARNETIFDPNLQVGPVMFGTLALFVLGLACLVVPALSSTAINGERDRGTLAVLQSTLLRPRDIILAKFLAGMVMATGFLAATIPLALWSFTEGGMEAGRALVVYLILLLINALLVMLGLVASALVRRPALSAAAAYGMVFMLTIGTLILYGLSLASAPQTDSEFAFERQIGWRWAILAPNPFVILADAAPRSQGQRFSDPLEGIRGAVRDSRRPPRRFDPETGALLDPETGEPLGGGDGAFLFDPEPSDEPPPLWPTGMAIDGFFALLAAYLARERLRIPARRLPSGERVA